MIETLLFAVVVLGIAQVLHYFSRYERMVRRQKKDAIKHNRKLNHE